MHNDIEKILVSEDEIKDICKRLGSELAEYYKGKDLVVVGVLRGAALFMIDLVKEMNTYLEIDFMDVSSYGEQTVFSGEVKIIKDLNTAVEGRHILLVEDIIDTGRTLRYLVDLMKYRKAASVKVVTLLDKPHRRVVDIEPDWYGTKIPDEFVVGYGLDWHEKYRNLPYVGILKEEFYKGYI